MSEHRCFKESWFAQKWDMIWGRNTYTPPPAVFPSTCVSLLPPHPNSPSFLWPYANQILLRSNSNLPKQDGIIFNFAFDIWWSSELVYWWEMHCCPNKLCFLSNSMESFKHKKQLQLFPVVDCVEWVVYEMLMWETWPLLPAEPQTSWVTLRFPLSFLRFLHLAKEKKTKQTKLQDKDTSPLLCWYPKYRWNFCSLRHSGVNAAKVMLTSSVEVIRAFSQKEIRSFLSLCCCFVFLPAVTFPVISFWRV